jgi:hypothetical protein
MLTDFRRKQARCLRIRNSFEFGIGAFSEAFTEAFLRAVHTLYMMKDQVNDNLVK